MTQQILSCFPYIPATKMSLLKRKPVCGVGINDAWYVIKPYKKAMCCPFYSIWVAMIHRCYGPTQRAYIGVTVTPEWLRFMEFRQWMEKQDWSGKELDKDILCPGNKVYSPETCLFVPQEINTLLVTSAARRGPNSLGVTYVATRKAFQAQLWRYGKHVHLGRFKTEKEASSAYLSAKSAHILELSASQPDPLRSALVRWAENLSGS